MQLYHLSYNIPTNVISWKILDKQLSRAQAVTRNPLYLWICLLLMTPCSPLTGARSPSSKDRELLSVLLQKYSYLVPLCSQNPDMKKSCTVQKGYYSSLGCVTYKRLGGLSQHSRELTNQSIQQQCHCIDYQLHDEYPPHVYMMVYQSKSDVLTWTLRECTQPCNVKSGFKSGLF